MQLDSGYGSRDAVAAGIFLEYDEMLTGYQPVSDDTVTGYQPVGDIT